MGRGERSWGSEGYVLLARGKTPDGAAGECGILTEPSFPVLADAALLV